MPIRYITRWNNKAINQIIDVRSPEEFAAGHVKGAINIPFDQIEQNHNLLNTLKPSTLVVYCRSGRRAGTAPSSPAPYTARVPPHRALRGSSNCRCSKPPRSALSHRPEGLPEATSSADRRQTGQPCRRPRAPAACRAS